MAQLFISYSTHNADFARYLRGLLQDAGFNVWMDETKLSAGQSWTDTLEANVTNCSAFVIIMSPESKASDWVRRERLLAEKLHKPMFPILLAGEAWWDLANIQYEDMRTGVKATLSPRMIEALRRAINGEALIAESEPTGMHIHIVAPPVKQTDSRKLEAAMPAVTKPGSDSEVWAKVSLPGSEGLRGELPVGIPSGDVIQKGDARASTFPVRFPLDVRTGERLPVQTEMRVSSSDFVVALAGEGVEVEIPPDADSRTVIFTLEAKPQGKMSGRSRIVIDLIYEKKVIAQVSVSTVLYERMTEPLPIWNLVTEGVTEGYIAPSQPPIQPQAQQTQRVSAQPSAMPIAPALIDPKTSIVIRRGMPSNAEAIANFITQMTHKNVQRMDIMLALGQKSYFIAYGKNDQVIGLIGWTVENLITCVDEFYISPNAPKNEMIHELSGAIDDASRELQSEICFIVLPIDTTQEITHAFIENGYELVNLSAIKYPSWQEAAYKLLSEANMQLVMKKLRADRVMKPI